jgi:hypothetical protein
MKSIVFVVATRLKFLDVALAEELKPHEGFQDIRWGASIEQSKRYFLMPAPSP